MSQKEGTGWRFAIDPSRNNYPVLIGGDGWAFELTKNEWSSLFTLVDELMTQHKQLEDQLMPEESIRLELERKPWWGCVDGDRYSWTLQLILDGGESMSRSVEASWPVPASQELVSAMRTMWDSCE